MAMHADHARATTLGLAVMGSFNHKTGAGYVAAKRGDYRDAIEKRKGRVHVVPELRYAEQGAQLVSTP